MGVTMHRDSNTTVYVEEICNISILLIMYPMQLHCLNTSGPNLHNP